MKIVILYTPRHKKLNSAATALGQFLEAQGHQVTHLHVEQSSTPPSVRRYDIIYLGSVTEGILGRKIPAEMADFIRQCRGFQHSKAVTFLPKRVLGTTKGMKNLMSLLESQGAQVLDFQVIAGQADVEALGRRLPEYP